MRRTAVLVLLAAVLAALPVAASASSTKPPPPADPSDKPRILLTGDSMMYVSQFRLFDRVAEAGGVPIADARFSTGITKPWLLDWYRYSFAQMARYQPNVTIMAIGANDHFPVNGEQCCSRVWQEGYAAMIRDLARTYGTTYWVTLPLPRSDPLRVAFKAVNRSIRLAVPDVRLIDIVPLFASRRPGKPPKTMMWQGRRVRVHQKDGVHLSKASVARANRLLVARLQADGVLPPVVEPVR